MLHPFQKAKNTTAIVFFAMRLLNVETGHISGLSGYLLANAVQGWFWSTLDFG